MDSEPATTVRSNVGEDRQKTCGLHDTSIVCGDKQVGKYIGRQSDKQYRNTVIKSIGKKKENKVK